MYFNTWLENNKTASKRKIISNEYVDESLKEKLVLIYQEYNLIKMILISG